VKRTVAKVVKKELPSFGPEPMNRRADTAAASTAPIWRRREKIDNQPEQTDPRPEGAHMPIERTTSVEPAPSRLHMPGYDSPEGPDGLMPWSWAEQRLEDSHNYWLATVRQDGRPHLMIVWGLWHGGVFYFSTGSRSRKARNLESNAHCVIGTEQAHEAVVVEGAAEKVCDVEQLKELLALYQRKYDYDMSAMQEDILALREPIFAVRPSVAFGLEEEAVLQNATRWRFAT
jgi:nitroimidazol reductase NimA-like FMN-containing flavoprotein (pyridoxamine 5'-phosphate oxidase superfamily)